MNTPDPASIAADIAAARNAGPSIDAVSIARAARILDALNLRDAPADRVRDVLYGPTPSGAGVSK